MTHGAHDIVARELYRGESTGLRGMVRVFNRALADTVKDPDAAIEVLLRHAPGADRVVDLARPGIGDMDDARLARLIALIVETKQLPRLLTVHEGFDRSFLPAEARRIRFLAG